MGAAVPRQLVWFDRSGNALGMVGLPDQSIFNPEISLDGRWIVFQRVVGLDRGIWIQDSSRATVSRFTVEEGRYTFPIWSPDGTRLVFGKTQEDGVVNLYQKPVNGSGREVRLLETPTASNPCDWSRDGRFILYRFTAASRDLWALPLEVDGKPFPFVATRFAEREGQFAPDGNFVAYQSNETGRFEIYLQPFPGPGEKSLVSTGGGEHPRWRPDGRELFYIAPDGSLMAVTVTAGKELKLGSPSKLFSTRIVREKTPGATVYNQQYDVSPDGERFLINVTTEEAVTSPITIVLNWKPPEKP
jgi:Tol biopolymer transport system component